MEKIGSTKIRFASGAAIEDALRRLAAEGMNGLHVDDVLTQEFVDEETRDQAFGLIQMDFEDGEVPAVGTRSLYEMNVNGVAHYVALEGDIVAASRKAIELFAGARINCVRLLGDVAVCSGE